MRRYVSAVACLLWLAGVCIHVVDIAGSTSSKTTDIHYNNVIVIVNGSIITIKDFEEQVKIVLMSSGIKDSPEVRMEILEDMINRKVKQQCMKKFAPPQGWVTKKEVKEAYAGIAARNMAVRNNKKRNDRDDAYVKEFNKRLKKGGIKPNLVEDNIENDLAWRNYIQAKYMKYVNISDKEVKTRRQDILNRRNQKSFFVSRISFPIFDKTDVKRVETKVQNIQKMLAQGTDFQDAARQFGEGPESKNNGVLGWVYKNQISAAEYNALKSMKPGEVRTVKTNKCVYILRLEDKKETGSSELHRVTIVQVALPQPKYAGGEDTRAVLDGLLNYIHTPAALIKQAKVIGCFVSEPNTGILENMNPEVREAIKSARNGISRVMSNEQAIYVFCILDQKAEKIPVPSLEQIRMNLMSDRFESYANKELHSLIEQAHIQKEEGYYALVRLRK